MYSHILKTKKKKKWKLCAKINHTCHLPIKTAEEKNFLYVCVGYISSEKYIKNKYNGVFIYIYVITIYTQKKKDK